MGGADGDEARGDRAARKDQPEGRSANEAVLFYLQRADTPQLRAQGLSGRKMLKQDEGMLFEYGSMGTRCMWMKDMHVPIDIVWLDAAKRVAAMERRIFPSTFPQQFCHQGSYVIEIPIGSSHGITPGQQVQF